MSSFSLSQLFSKIKLAFICVLQVKIILFSFYQQINFFFIYLSIDFFKHFYLFNEYINHERVIIIQMQADR